MSGTWTPNLVGPIDPARCPLGCPLDAARRGSCDALADPETRGRPCYGYAATTCDAAYAAWKAADGPSLPRADLERVAPRAPAPAIVPAGVSLPPIFASAPESLEAWDIYAPHEPTADGRSFLDRLQREHRERAAAIARTGWLAARETGAPWLLLLGQPGNGKTLLLRILGRQAALAGLRVRYTLFEDMVKAVKATRDPASALTEDAVLEGFLRPDLLIIDDIRPVFNSQDDENIAHDVIKTRYAVDLGLRRKLTWAASNLSIKELARVIGVAALDRYLHAGTEPWFFLWPSYRRLEASA